MRTEAGIASLSSHVLQKVLEKLDDEADRKSWRLTCTLFYFIQADSQTTVRIFNSEITEQVLSKHTNINSLDLSSCVTITDENLASVAKFAGTRLLSLCLSRMGGFTVDGIVAFARACSSLVKLDLRCCSNFGDLELAAVCQLGNLTSLDLTGCFMISDAGLGCLAAGCKKLETLVLKGCVGISDAGLCFLASNCKELRNIDVSYTEITDAGVRCLSNLMSLKVLNLSACSNVGDEALNRTNTSLMELDISCCKSVTNAGISFLSKGSLQLLKLGFCSPVTCEIFQAIGKLTQIQVLKLAGCEFAGDGLHFVALSCLQLSELSLSKCRGVTDEGIASVVVGCKKLRKLDLTCCADVTESTAYTIARSSAGLVSLKIEALAILTESSTPLLMERCSGMEELDVTDCNITDTGVEYIARCKLLRSLKLGFCRISDVGISHVGKMCSSLVELDLYRSETVGDPGVASIAAGCPQLRVLILSYCPNISNASIVSVSQLKQLRQLELRGCKQVSLVGLEKWLPKFRNTIELDLKHCSIGDPGMKTIAHCFSNLQQLNVSYCPMSNTGLAMLAELKSLQNVKLVHLGSVSMDSAKTALLRCSCLKKVKLLCDGKRDTNGNYWMELEDRGCRVRLVKKPKPS